MSLRIKNHGRLFYKQRAEVYGPLKYHVMDSKSYIVN